jgi:very-short-patch-repair endonuclease
LNCNIEFTPKRSSAKYCSIKCCNDHQTTSIKVNCLLCGDEFVAKPCKIKENKGKYCSKTCANISKRKFVKKNRPLVNLQCGYCGKDILVRSYKSKKYKHRFCSKECFRSYLSETFCGENNPSYKNRTIIKKCEICNKDFKARLIDIEKGRDRFCSRECHCKHMETLIGEKNPRYKRYEASCATCGETLRLRKNEINREVKNHFCSRSCIAVYTLKYLTPNKSTSIERAIKSVLDYLNITYEEQYIVSGFIADFYLPDYNLIIECDGDYWHNRPEQIIKDKRKNAVYKRFGYSLLRLWEHDIKQDALGLITKNLKII